MKKPILRNSTVNLYEFCPKKYDLIVNKNEKSDLINSSLVFGSAIDSALNSFLQTKMENPVKSEQSALEIFLNNMEWAEINDRLEFVPDYPKIRYFKSDFQSHIISKESEDKFIEKLKEKGYFETSIYEFMDYFQGSVKGTIHKPFTDDEKYLANYAYYLSLIEKGKLMLSAYENDILPQIEKVYSIQKGINLQGENSDVEGTLDFVAKFYNDDNIYICDNKTAKNPFKLEDLMESQQLALYTYAENSQYAAYINLEKNIRKKEKTCRTSIVRGKISEESQIQTLQKFEIVGEKVRRDAELGFDGKDNPKQCFEYGNYCEMYEKCWGKKL